MFDSKNHFDVHQMAKLELQNHFGYILNVIRPHIQRGSRAQMIALPPPGLNRVNKSLTCSPTHVSKKSQDIICSFYRFYFLSSDDFYLTPQNWPNYNLHSIVFLAMVFIQQCIPTIALEPSGKYLLQIMKVFITDSI